MGLNTNDEAVMTSLGFHSFAQPWTIKCNTDNKLYCQFLEAHAFIALPDSPLLFPSHRNKQQLPPSTHTMSFLGGAECSTAGNPLSQFTKHVHDDKSLQRDRLVGQGPGGLQESFRSQANGSSQDEVSCSVAPDLDSCAVSCPRSEVVTDS